MNRTLAIGDIHGNARGLEQALYRANFEPETDRLIVLGDVSDGPYPFVAECVDLLLAIPHRVDLMGNHDDWFLFWLRTGLHPDRWEQGGEATYLSYRNRTGRLRSDPLNPADVPDAHRTYFRDMLPFWVQADTHDCFVHAGFDRRVPVRKQHDPSVYYWDRDLWQQALAYGASLRGTPARDPERSAFTADRFRRVFIGHTSTTNWNTTRPMRGGHVHNLDTGSGHGGPLTIMDTESLQFWQSDPGPALYPGLEPIARKKKHR